MTCTNARVAGTSRKKNISAAKPVGPVSVRGAKSSAAPEDGAQQDRFFRPRGPMRGASVPALLHEMHKKQRAVNQRRKTQPGRNQQVKPHALPLSFAMGFAKLGLKLCQQIGRKWKLRTLSADECTRDKGACFSEGGDR